MMSPFKSLEKLISFAQSEDSSERFIGNLSKLKVSKFQSYYFTATHHIGIFKRL